MHRCLSNMEQQKIDSHVGHTSSGIKRAHELSDLDKEKPHLTIDEGVREDL